MCPMEEQALRTALETGLPDIGQALADRTERVALVDEANSFRPRSLT